MDLTSLVSTLQTYLNGQLSAPVLTPSGTDEYDTQPLPAVILEHMLPEPLTFHNSNLAQVVENDTPGTGDDRYYRYQYYVRLDYLIRAADDESVVALYDSMQAALFDFVEEPHLLHEDVREFDLRNGGGIDHVFVEDTESEMNLPVRIRSFDQVKRTDTESIDSITETFTVTN